MNWRDKAACKGMSPDIFFAERGEDQKVREAKAVCATCPVTAECYDWAVVNENFGVWGGTTIVDRRMIRRRTPGSRRDRPNYIGHATRQAMRH